MWLTVEKGTNVTVQALTRHGYQSPQHGDTTTENQFHSILYNSYTRKQEVFLTFEVPVMVILPRTNDTVFPVLASSHKEENKEVYIEVKNLSNSYLRTISSTLTM